MDKFEQAMQQMAQMTEEDRMKMVESKKKLCICGGCPTYNDCARENKELLYCALGKSPTCITEENGCICPSCPLTEQWDSRMSFSVQETLKRNKEECNLRTYLLFQRF